MDDAQKQAEELKPSINNDTASMHPDWMTKSFNIPINTDAPSTLKNINLRGIFKMCLLISIVLLICGFISGDHYIFMAAGLFGIGYAIESITDRRSVRKKKETNKEPHRSPTLMNKYPTLCSGCRYEGISCTGPTLRGSLDSGTLVCYTKSEEVLK